MVDVTVGDLEHRCNRWAEMFGYRVTNVTVALDVECLTTVGVTVEATVIPRVDGVWGDVRTCLEEDGLLPTADAAWLSERGVPGPMGVPGPTGASPIEWGEGGEIDR